MRHVRHSVHVPLLAAIALLGMALGGCGVTSPLASTETATAASAGEAATKAPSADPPPSRSPAPDVQSLPSPQGSDKAASAARAIPSASSGNSPEPTLDPHAMEQLLGMVRFSHAMLGLPGHVGL